MSTKDGMNEIDRANLYLTIIKRVTIMNAVIEAVNISDVNKSAILSTVASELFQANLNPRIALITATAYVGALEYMDDEDMFMEAFVDGLEITELTVKGTEVPDDAMNIDEIVGALQASQYITDDHKVGPRITELLELRQ